MRSVIMHRAKSALKEATGPSRFRKVLKGERTTDGFLGRWTALLMFLWVTALIFSWTLPVQAQRGAYPSAPVKVMVGFPPGGGVDVVARLVGQKMVEVWGQPVVVENRPGASSGIATRIVAGAAPDGYTALMNSNSMIVNQVANPDAGYDVERQLIPIINVAWQPTVIVAANDLPVSSLGDVISLAGKRKLNYGTPGQASIPHLAGAYLFNLLSKIDMLHVPYKGAAPALSALVANQIDLAFVTLPPAIPLIKSGRMKAIAVTAAKRTASLPEIPTVGESGFPGYVVNVFAGYFMPAGTPRPVIDTFRQTVLKVISMGEIKEKLAGLGFEQADTSKEDFPRLVSEEIRQWAKVVKEANIKIE